MIPWFQITSIPLGSIALQVWGTLVALGFLLGAYLAWRRMGKTPGAKIIWDMAFWILLAAAVGARLFHAAFYEPAYYSAHLSEIFDFTASGFSVLGGFLGGAAVVWFFVKRKNLNFLKVADAMAWGLPWGYAVGRMGCFLIHDHPGLETSFMLGMRFPDGIVRHDLGLYAVILGVFIGLIFLVVDRLGLREPKPGFWSGLFLVIYSVGRWALDFLRAFDQRWAGLTPAQWILMATAAIGVWLVIRSTCRVKYR
jgi:phosphatidylglycerol:prolipoprotein diacylglycerol transferase